MACEAAHLLDHVLPSIPLRQWVLTVPPPLCYFLAYDASLCSVVLGCFMQALFGYLRRTAKREFGLRSVREQASLLADVMRRTRNRSC